MDPNLPRISIQFKNGSKTINTTILIDSCSSACIVSEEVLTILDLSYITKKYKLITANNTDTVTLLGNVDLYFTIFDNSDEDTELIKHTFLVSKTDVNIIGIDFLKQFKYQLDTDNLKLEFPLRIYRNKNFTTSILRTNEPIIASIEDHEIMPNEIIWIQTSLKSKSMKIDWDNANVELFKHTHLELLSQNTAGNNILNLMIKNTSYDTYIQITEGESMGYVVLQARTSHNFFMTVKP